MATGASAEFGRTAGGIINVITKSGTNEVHGSLFHFQRLEALTANTSDGKPLTDFHREQFGGTIGGPIKKDKAFYFFAFEGIQRKPDARQSERADRQRRVRLQRRRFIANEALINGKRRLPAAGADQFLQNDAQSGRRIAGQHSDQKPRFSRQDRLSDLTTTNQLRISYNFDHSKNTNQTFDVSTYGNSANGIEGPSKINIFNVNLFTHDFADEAERSSLLLLARRRARVRRYLRTFRPTRRWGFATDVPVRQSVFPRAER